MLDQKNISQLIKTKAFELGFDACGFCRADYIGDEESKRVGAWISQDYHADMAYMANNFEKRCNPTLLEEGAISVVSLALGYYPDEKQREDVPQIAYYAYGKDYHDVMKKKLQELFLYIKSLVPHLSGRVFCDTAPFLERYWAAQAGLGFIGKNSLLIIPKKGSYFFLGELLLNIELEYDKPLNLSCGRCTRCLDTCPTKAIVEPRVINSNYCISYQTIENKGEISSYVKPLLNNRFYGCDLCQQVCPWNRYAKKHDVSEFAPSEEFLSLNSFKLENMSIEDYQRIFKGSAIKRAKQSGLKRNINALKK